MKLISPIFMKELAQLAQSRRLPWMKGLFIGVLVIGLLIVMAESSFGGTYGPAVFGCATFIALTAITIFTPVVTAGAVCGEKETRTLGLLFMTRLTSWNIVQDKGLSRVAFLFYICMLTFPFMAAAVMCGGVEPAQVLNAIGNLTGLTLLCAGISLFASTFTSRYISAVACTFAALILYLLILPILIGWIWQEGVAWQNPYVSVSMVGSAWQLKRMPWLRYTWISNLAIGMLIYLIALGISAASLRRIAIREQVVDERGKKTRGKKLARFLMFWNPGTWFMSHAMPKGNPVRWLLCDPGRDSTRRVMIHITNTGCVVYTLIMAALIFDDVGMRPLGRLLISSPSALPENVPAFFNSLRVLDEDFIAISHAIGILLSGILVCVIAAGTITRQREASTFDVLNSTALSAHALAQGAVAGTFQACFPVLFLPLYMTITANLFGDSKDVSLAVPIINLVVYMSFFILMSLFISMKQKSSAKAVAITAVAMIVLCIVIPMFAGFMNAEEFLALSPSLWLVTGVLAGEIFDRSFSPLSWVGYLFVTFGLYLPAALALYAAIVKKYDDFTGRAPGTSRSS